MMQNPRRAALLFSILAVVSGLISLMIAGFISDRFNPRALALLVDEISAMIGQHYVLAVTLYLSIYVLAMLFLIPCAMWLSIAGGVLFGTLAGGVYAVLGATIGSAAALILAR